jgi:hypothetical protein
MGWNEDWIEITPTSTAAKQRVRKSTIGSYGKCGRLTVIQRDIFDSSNNFSVLETVDDLDRILGRSQSGPNYQRKPNTADTKITKDGKSCANCLHFDFNSDTCHLKQYIFGDDRPMNYLCPAGEWK